MNSFNRFLTAAFELICTPLLDWPLALLLLSAAISGVLMSLVFKYTSNQANMANVLDRSRGHILAIKLFKDDLPGMFSSLANVFRYTLQRLWYSLVPILFLILPLYLLMSQLYLRFEHRPLAPGENAIVELQIKKDAWNSNQSIQLEVDPKLVVETDPMRDQKLSTIFWRIQANESGISRLRWQVGEQLVVKSIVAADDISRVVSVNSRRVGTVLEQTWFQGEDGMGQSPAVTALVHYPKRETPFMGLSIPWWLTFFAASIVAALLAQPILKVRF